jgi:hypothetical protein
MRRRSLQDKVVLITGAARGIGEATARQAAARGARLALVGLEPDRLEALAAELGPRHTWAQADVTDQVAVDAAVTASVEALGGIDVVLANAGIGAGGTVASTPVDALVRTIDVNLNGVIRTVAAALPHVIARRGYVQIVSSAAAFTVLPGMAAYCASKAGVEQFGNALRLEVAHLGVKVGTVHPSWIDTDLLRDERDRVPTLDETLPKLPWPMNSTTSPEECAAAIVDGMERRARRVYVPKAVGLVQALRALVLSPAGDLPVRRAARDVVPRMEREAAERTRPAGRAGRS